ncbi:MAG: hypothetical protein NC483_04310 [Ruminococcus sp.]|nr:hypothetical protein [Ruminococcus sp.]
MKKIFLLSIIAFLLTGCTSIKKSNIETILNEGLNSQVKTLNINRNGYRYYLPKGLKVVDSTNYNEILTNQKYKLYLYVDIVSYNSKVDFNYKLSDKGYYSSTLQFKGKKGYIEINNYKNNQYLIEIMYNYAKIEVVVYEEDIKEIVSYAISILTSITYNDSVISSNLNNNVFQSLEETFDIFEIIGSDNYIRFTDEETSDDERKDPDYVN